MPNWCSNSVLITGASEEVSRLVDFVKDEHSTFSLNKMIPRPLEEEENWYEWNCKNWGTKWNIAEVSVSEKEGEVTFDFDSAWSPPIPAVIALAGAFPMLKIVHMYAEPGVVFGGIITMQGTDVESVQAEDNMRSVAALSEWHEMQCGYEEEMDDSDLDDMCEDDDEDEHEATNEGGAV